MNIYRKQLCLRNRDVNLYRRLRTSTMFEWMQEASIRHTEELGMGRKMTLDRGLLWVVTLQRAEIARMPEYDECITLESWPGETMHLLFPRYYRMLGADGETLVAASALWALVDSETRRMVSPGRYGVHVDGVTTGCEISVPSPPRRAAGSESISFTVPFSYVDLNGHMNNTRYFDLAEDCLPPAAEGQALKELSVEYANEARMGDTISILRECADDAYYLSGETDRRIFRMRFVYE